MYEFCPKCGGKLDLKTLKEGDPDRLVCRECSFIFYQNPTVAVGTLLTIDGGIVLLRRSIEPGYGMWCIPSGYVERGETVEESAVRESWEEACLEVEIRRLFNVYSYSGRPIVMVVMEADIVGGELAAGDETLEARTFAPEEIPWDEIAFSSTRDALKDFIAEKER